MTWSQTRIDLCWGSTL